MSTVRYVLETGPGAESHSSSTVEQAKTKQAPEDRKQDPKWKQTHTAKQSTDHGAVRKPEHDRRLGRRLETVVHCLGQQRPPHLTSGECV